MRVLLAVLLAIAMPGLAAPVGDLAETVAAAEKAAQDPGAIVDNPVGTAQGIVDPPASEGEAAPPQDPVNPDFMARIRDAFHDQMVVAGLATLFVAGLSVAGFAMVTRYVKPEEALSNPQRSMLYGFIRGNPGVHLKKLSEEFSMKTSSILWHIRKLENAQLVRSDRANGFRVFYPTAGGAEMKMVSRATTALQNTNARHVFEAVEKQPGAASTDLASSTHIHAGTVRWHLRKLREFALVEEVEGPNGARYFPTQLGLKAAKTLRGAPGGVQLPPERPVHA